MDNGLKIRNGKQRKKKGNRKKCHFQNSQNLENTEITGSTESITPFLPVSNSNYPITFQFQFQLPSFQLPIANCLHNFFYIYQYLPKPKSNSGAGHFLQLLKLRTDRTLQAAPPGPSNPSQPFQNFPSPANQNTESHIFHKACFVDWTFFFFLGANRNEEWWKCVFFFGPVIGETE